jgi:hypothetical protein
MKTRNFNNSHFGRKELGLALALVITASIAWFFTATEAFSSTPMATAKLLPIQKRPATAPLQMNNDSRQLMAEVRPLVQVNSNYTRAQLNDRRLLSAASTFNETEYMQLYPEVAAQVRAGYFSSATAHYWQVGAAQGRNPSLLFNEKEYLKKNPDVAARVRSGEFVSGFQHFQLRGASEGRAYRPNFDEIAYLDSHPDIAMRVKSGELTSGLVYYVTHGRNAQITQYARN